MKKWTEFMIEHTSPEEVETKWLPNYYAEDRPIPLTEQLELLKQAGFQQADVVYKRYNFAVTCALRTDDMAV